MRLVLLLYGGGGTGEMALVLPLLEEEVLYLLSSGKGGILCH